MREINWSIIMEQMGLNKNFRVNWKAYFGVSLTRLIAQCKSEGLNQNQTYVKIVQLQPDLPEELKRRLMIGIAARNGESETFISEMNKKKGDVI